MSNILNTSPQEIAHKFYSLVSPEDVSSLLDVRHDLLVYYLYRFPLERQYRTFYISKKNGSLRKISAPVSSLKIIQRQLNYVLQCVYTPRSSVHGFLFKRGIVTNAKAHTSSYSKCILNLDLDDFFPSINFGRVRGMFMAKPYNLPSRVATILAQVCCYENELPQGAPTSPIVSNMLCAKLDHELSEVAYLNRCTYTRYADDISFSTTWNNFPEELSQISEAGNIHIGPAIRKIVEVNGFSINQSKVRLQFRHQRQEITGLIVNSSKPNVKRRYIRQIRAMLHAWKKYGYTAAQEEFWNKYDHKWRNPWDPPPLFMNVVRGKIEYVGMVRGSEDQLYQKFLKQFFELLNNQRLGEIHQNRQEDIRLTSTNQSLKGSMVSYSATASNEPDIAEQMLTVLPNNGEVLAPGEFELQIQSVGDRQIKIQLIKPESHDIQLSSELPFSSTEVEIILKILTLNISNSIVLTLDQKNLLDRLGLLHDGKPIQDMHQVVGEKLFEALLPGCLGKSFRIALEHIRYPKRAISLQLRLNEKDTKLSQLPWELLHFRQPLLINGAVNLTRFIDERDSPLGIANADNLRILYVGPSSPNRPSSNTAAPNQASQFDILCSALENLEREKKLSLYKLDSPTFSKLDDFLNSSDINILHFEGHGVFAKQCPQCKQLYLPHLEICSSIECGISLENVSPYGYLGFEKELPSNETHWVPSIHLNYLLSKYGIQLAVLSASQSGTIGGDTLWNSVGPALIQAKIPAVVAMQAPISSNSATEFMRGFYSAIADSVSLPEAIQHGRRKLITSGNEWFIPVIYWRSRDHRSPFLKKFPKVSRASDKKPISKLAVVETQLIQQTEVESTGSQPSDKVNTSTAENKITILFLAANPKNTEPLQLAIERREIKNAIRMSDFRDHFVFEEEWAVRVSEIQGYLLQHQPTIIHFSGHATKSSQIILEDASGNSQPVPTSALAGLFSTLKDNIRCVVLNACYSEEQAQAIAQHIECVIGMSDAVTDDAAINFAKSFYQALGYGRSVKTAFELGVGQINLDGLDEINVPKLLCIHDQPEALILVGE